MTWSTHLGMPKNNRFSQNQGVAASQFPQGLLFAPKVCFCLKTRVLRRCSSRRGFFFVPQMCFPLETRVLRRRSSRFFLFSSNKCLLRGKKCITWCKTNQSQFTTTVATYPVEKMFSPTRLFNNLMNLITRGWGYSAKWLARDWAVSERQIASIMSRRYQSFC